MDAIDKSISAVIITKVMPTLIMPTCAILSNMTEILLVVTNREDQTAPRTTSATRAPVIPAIREPDNRLRRPLASKPALGLGMPEPNSCSPGLGPLSLESATSGGVAKSAPFPSCHGRSRRRLQLFTSRPYERGLPATWRTWAHRPHGPPTAVLPVFGCLGQLQG